VFNSLSDRLTATFKNLRGKGKLSEADVDATVREIRRALLDADVAVPVVREFTAAVKERALSAEVNEALNPGQQVVKIVNDQLQEILGGQTRRIRMAKTGPTIIMLAGLQGAGKTTLAGKLSYWLKSQGHRPLLVASDLQRPNAVTQLKVVGERAGVPVWAPHPGTTSEFDDPTGDPVEVAREGVEHARSKLYDVVIVDTAGRLGVDQPLMRQARDIRDAVQPDEVLFVIDAMIGQDAVQTAQAFNEGVDFTGVVLSKLDGDARGGAALSVASVTGKPIMFASTGEGVKDFEQFHPDRMASRILDMGDVMTLIEQAEKTWDQAEAQKMAKKFADQEDFTFEDFLAQMQQLKKMGSMKKLLGMMPGMAGMREQLENFDESALTRIEAIIQSMTPHERVAPKIMNGSRRARIAKGSGATVQEVNQLMERFGQAQKMMRKMSQGKGMPNLPGMGGGAPGMGPQGGNPMAGMQGMQGMQGLPGVGGGKSSKSKAKKKGSRSGNPAKRAQEAAAAQNRSKAPTGSSFGQPQQPEQNLKDLPKGFEKFLK